MAKSWKEWRSSKLWRYGRDGLILLGLVYGVELFQARNMLEGPLPADLKTRSLPSPDGPTHSLWSPSQYTLLYVFAPWCGVCKVSADNIGRVPSSRFHVAALALSYREPAEVKDFAQQHGLDVPVLLGSEETQTVLGIDSFPSYLLIDREGKIVRAWSGYTTTLGLWAKSFAALVL